MLDLLKSQKFIAALLGVLVIVAVHYGVDEARAKAIADWVGTLVIAYIGGHAVVDAAVNVGARNGGVADLDK